MAQNADHGPHEGQQSSESIRAEIHRLAEKLAGLLTRFPTMDMLAHFSFHEEFADPSSYSEDTHEGKQAFVEYLTLLALKQQCSPGAPPFASLAMEDVHEDVSKAFRLANQLAPPRLSRTDKAGDQYGWLAYMLHQHAKLLRNPGFKKHRDEVMDALCGPISQWSEEALGFSYADARTMNRGIETLLNARLVSRREGLQNAQSAYRAAATRYRTTGQLEAGLAPDLIKRLSRLKRGQRKRALVDLGVDEMFRDFGDLMQFTAAELANHVGLPLAKADAYLVARRSDFGTVPADFEVPDVREDLVLRPIVHSEGKYLAPVLSLLDWGLRPFYESVLNPDAPHTTKSDVVQWQRYRDNRASSLEQVARRAFQSALPDARIESNLSYKIRVDGESVEGEIDCLVVWGTVAILIEAKSGAFSWKAKAGSLPHLEDTLAKTVRKAQSQMVAFKKLLASGATIPLSRRGTLPWNLDGRTIERTFMVAVTLEDMSMYTTWLRQLVDCDVLAPDGLPWAVLIFDLCAIAELCETPSQFLCFLERREKLSEEGLIMAGSELDFWGWFLSHGLRFNTGGAEKPHWVQLSSGTREIEHYFYHQEGWRKTPTKRPLWAMPETLKLAVTALDETADAARINAALGIQDLVGIEQDKLVKEIERNLRLSRKDGRARGFSVRPQNLPAQLWVFLTAPRPAEVDIRAYLARMPDEAKHGVERCVCVAFAPGPRVEAVLVCPPS